MNTAPLPVATRFRRRFHRAPLLLAGLVAVAATTALAFEVDRAADGQIVRFDRAPVTVYLQARGVSALSLAKVQQILSFALETWNEAPGADIQLEYGGLVLEPPLFDVYVTFDGAYDLSEGDLTGRTLRVRDASGRLTRTEIHLNSGDYEWVTADPLYVSGPVADLQAALTHQLGHVLGLGHSRDGLSTMYFHHRGAAGRELAPDDLRAARFLYGTADKAEGKWCDACQTDADCADGRLCLAWPDGARHCAQPCTTHDECPIGASCGSYSTGKACLPNDGHCRADSASSGFGQPCASNLACGDNRYCLSGGKFAFCSKPCTSSCGGQGQCVDWPSGGATCLTWGKDPIGSPCMVGSTCASGLCVPSLTAVGRCSVSCSDTTDCPKAYTCDRTHTFSCTQAGPLALGWPCESAFDCASALCVEHPGGPFTRACSQPCEVATDCPAGTGCTPLDDDQSFCLPYGAPQPGSPCTSPGGCGSKMACDVGPVDGVGMCRTVCAPFGDDLDCPGGQRCVWVGAATKTGGVCRDGGGGAMAGMTCGKDAVCRFDLVCAAGPSEAPTCRLDCAPGKDATCGPGLVCAPLDGSLTHGACAASLDPLAETPTTPTLSKNFAARTLNFPTVVPAAQWQPPTTTTASAGCTATPSADLRTGWLLATLLLTALALPRAARKRRE
ncbi:MAG: matrixin family metalloprotease [Myxococcota bacterium]